jgi:hypothetical protein
VLTCPQLFKHHQSVLTGHLKMMDMVRKHCVEGSGNYETAKACVDRTHQMMKMFKEVMYNFVSLKSLFVLLSAIFSTCMAVSRPR